MKTKYVRALFIVLSLLTAWSWGGVVAAQPLGGEPGPWGSWYMSVSGGALNAKDNPGQLESPGSGLALGFAAGYRYSRYIDLEIEMPLFYSRYDTPATVVPPLFGSVSSRSDVSTLGVVGNVIFSVRSPSLRPFAGVGGGLYFSRFSVTAQTFGYPGTYETDDSNFGYQWFAGVDLPLGGGSWLGLEYRQLNLTANFGTVTNGEIDLGGQFILLNYRRGF